MKVATSLAELLPKGTLGAAPGLVGTPRLGAEPEAVVHPETAEDVAATLRWASQEGIGVLTLASGRRLHARPLDRPFVLLMTDRLRGIDIYEPADLTMTARAGTPLAEISSRLAEHRQWLPFDPPRIGERSLGGLVASGESGPAWMGYGELRNHVLGATVVTGDGRVLELGGRVVKNVAGFDLLKAVVGSRGGLAVVTSVCVRAFPVPAEDRLLVVRGERARDLLETARAVGTAPVLPVSCVLVTPAASLGAGAALLVRLHGAPPTVDADQGTLERHCDVSFERPERPEAVADAARDHASETSPTLVAAVLPSRLDDALAAVGRAFGDAPVAVDAYAGRIRVAPRVIDVDVARSLRTELERLGGALSVRVGLEGGGAEGARLADVSSPPDEHAARLVAGLQRVFDPEGVLWPCRP